MSLRRQDDAPSADGGRFDARWLLREGEGRAVLASGAAYMFLLCGYYMLRSLREAYALEVGREHIATLFYVALAVMVVVLPLYWFVVARLPRRLMFPAIYSAVAVLFLCLAFGMEAMPGGKLLPAVYWVSVTSLNLFIVSVFWSVMVDAWRSGSAKRVFGFIAAGGSLGAIIGPMFNSLFVERVGATAVIVIAVTLLLVAAALGHRAQAAEARSEGLDPAARLSLPVGGRAIEDIKRLVTSPYLLAIAGLVVLGQIIGGFMYQEQAEYVEAAYSSLESRAALFAKIDWATNGLALVFQAGVVGWLAARGGLRAALGAVPVLLLGSFVLLALAPVGAVLIATQVLRRAIDYGLFKPTREMLFTVLNPESKFKSKSLNDTVLQRGGDSLSQATYPLVAGSGLVGVAWSLAGVSVLMLGVALWLAGVFGRRESGSGAP